ncbi:MAG: nucleotide exchange factor GrpE [Bacteroidales bacterium]|jgi:molecular chaperone GrpE|nr:nucleotide exchange factor GrpE [Bacteroidales bacterium]
MKKEDIEEKEKELPQHEQQAEQSEELEQQEQQEPSLQDELTQCNDKYLRLVAEFDNFRRRSMKEKLEMLQSAAEDTITDLLPVIDDFERALKAMENKADEQTEGIKLIYQKFQKILSAKGVSAIEVLGEKFDEATSEAVANTPVQDKSCKGTVVDVIEKGYKLNDKVIRYAKVIVGE